MGQRNGNGRSSRGVISCLSTKTQQPESGSTHSDGLTLLVKAMLRKSVDLGPNEKHRELNRKPRKQVLPEHRECL